VLLVITLATACSTGTQSGSSSSATASKPSGVSGRADLKIAYFSAGTSNAYLQAGIAAAKQKAKEMGADLDVFDGQFNAQEQFNQMQTALTSGKYNAFAVEPNDGNLVCNLLTKQAPQKGILVSIFNLPICGRATNLGVKTWEPGTVTYVGGQTLDIYNEWIKTVMKENPEGGKIALISGPDLNANSICFFKAAKAFASNPKFKIVAKQTTDYTTPKAFQAAQTILQSNPDLNIIMSNFSGMTRGVVKAVGSKNVKIYDFGGDAWALSNVRTGRLAQTVMMLPRQESIQALEALGMVADGKTPPKFINLSKDQSLPGTPFADKQNLSQFKAEY
jgi:ribose transport system substrate-binding protein